MSLRRWLTLLAAIYLLWLGVALYMAWTRQLPDIPVAERIA